MASESNYHATKNFLDNLLATEMKRNEKNEKLYFGLLILEISKIVIYVFCYDFVKSKRGNKPEIMLHGYRQLNSKRCCKRSCNKI